MNTPTLFVACGILLGIISASRLSADQLEMQNGDRYVGKVLSVSANTVLWQSEVLGKINLPRSKVASLTFETNTALPKVTANATSNAIPTNLPDVASLTALAKSKTNSASSTDAVQQIREQMLAGSPEATAKYNELAGGFLSGKLDMNDLRREAKSSADQLRKLKSELGPEAGDSLDAYLEILDGFLNESAAEPPSKAPVVPSKKPAK